MPDYDSLLASASELPLDARIQFIEALWTTVPDEALPPLSSEWVSEIERRSAEYDNGSVRPVAWNEVRNDAIARLKRSD
jgi:putative addiction module component (TIGR02574 family)